MLRPCDILQKVNDLVFSSQDVASQLGVNASFRQNPKNSMIGILFNHAGSGVPDQSHLVRHVRSVTIRTPQPVINGDPDRFIGNGCHGDLCRPALAGRAQQMIELCRCLDQITIGAEVEVKSGIRPSCITEADEGSPGPGSACVDLSGKRGA